MSELKKPLKGSFKGDILDSDMAVCILSGFCGLRGPEAGFSPPRPPADAGKGPGLPRHLLPRRRAAACFQDLSHG